MFLGLYYEAKYRTLVIIIATNTMIEMNFTFFLRTLIYDRSVKFVLEWKEFFCTISSLFACFTDLGVQKLVLCRFWPFLRCFKPLEPS